MNLKDRFKGVVLGIKEKLKWIDPFTYVDLYVIPKLNPHRNEFLNWVIYIIFAFIFALLIYFFLGFVLATNTPLVIVVSESMEPVLHRGDVMILQGIPPEAIKAPQVDFGDKTLEGVPLSSIADLEYGINEKGLLSLISINFKSGEKIFPTTEGDIVVYVSDISGEQIIHRVVVKLKARDGYYLITKGDNVHTNPTVDQDCGKIFLGQPQKPCISRYPVNAQKILGKTIFRIPLLGYIKLIIFDDLPTIIFGCPPEKKCYFP